MALLLCHHISLWRGFWQPAKPLRYMVWVLHQHHCRCARSLHCWTCHISKATMQDEPMSTCTPAPSLRWQTTQHLIITACNPTCSGCCSGTCLAASLLNAFLTNTHCSFPFSYEAGVLPWFCPSNATSIQVSCFTWRTRRGAWRRHLRIVSL